MTEETIFHEALACQSRQEREAFVARACGGDESLFSRVQGLLSAHDSPDAYLAQLPQPLNKMAWSDDFWELCCAVSRDVITIGAADEQRFGAPGRVVEKRVAMWR